MARDERNCLARHRNLFHLPFQRAFALRLDEGASGSLSCLPYLGEKILVSILVEYQLAYPWRFAGSHRHRRKESSCVAVSTLNQPNVVGALSIGLDCVLASR